MFENTRAAEAERALGEARAEAAGCRNCPLWETATQTVFGVGPATARLVFIAEAPGHHEDLTGIPFMGPAGRMLDEALTQAGIPRDEIYITNVVKHRPWVQAGDLKKNRAPKQSEINACRPWLARELEIIRPPIIACLGAPAARWILGKDFKLTQQRGQWFNSEYAPHVLATIHPAYVLIQPEEYMRGWRDTLFADFRLLGEQYRALSSVSAA
jgi:DNA polymerase